jgi:opacity protein-like surface antigen
MTRRVLPAVLVFATLFAASTAHAAKMAATFYPGAAIPIGDFADDSLGNAQTGFQFGASLDAKLNEHLSAGIEFSWAINNNGLEGKKVDLGGGFYTRADQYEYQIRQYGLRGRYFLTSGSRFHPFALVGVGAYDVELHYDVALGGPVPTQEVMQSGKTDYGTRFGGRGGLGFEYEVSPSVLLGLGANYNYVSMDEAEFGSSSIAFWEVRASIGHDFK